MYKLMLVTDQKEVRDMFENAIDWAHFNCRPPMITSSASEAIEWLNTRAIDAVSYHLPKNEAKGLVRFLESSRPSLPIFQAAGQPEKQQLILTELVSLLDRMHADFSDDYYDEDAMLTIRRDELSHMLLGGEVCDREWFFRELELIRSRVDPMADCLVYDLDMPQGEVYLSEHYQAQQRLEQALRNNFFGRYVDGTHYAVAVLSPRHIRLVCAPLYGEEKENAASFYARTDEHVRDTIQKIKEYLDLDLNICQIGWINGLGALMNPVA